MLTKKAMQPRNSRDTTTAAIETIRILRQSFLSLAFRFADMFLFCFMLITIGLYCKDTKNIDYLVTYTLKLWQKK